jgi:hypothetical protein
MLFDLQAPGRRRLVKFVYGFLALLIGGGLVLFGVGGSGFGLLNTDQNNGGGSNSGTSVQQQAVKEETKAAAPALPGAKVKLSNAQQAALWASATRLRVQAASSGFDTNTGQYTEAGRQELQAAATDWQRYLSLQSGKVDLTLAKLMAQAYGETGLANGKDGVRAWEIVVAAEPTGPNYAQLALAAYSAGNNKVGNQFSAKALSMMPKAQRATLKNQFIAAKAQFKLKQQQAAKQGSQGSSISPLGG